MLCSRVRRSHAAPHLAAVAVVAAAAATYLDLPAAAAAVFGQFPAARPVLCIFLSSELLEIKRSKKPDRLKKIGHG